MSIRDAVDRARPDESHPLGKLQTMREQDAVFLLYLPMTFALYALFSTHHLSTVLGRPGPPWLARFREAANAQPAPTIRAALRSYFGWTAFTQLAPLLVALSNAIGYVRIASAIEVLAAMAWTGYLRLRLSS